MKSKDTFIQEILKDIYGLSIPELEDSRRWQISNIINVVVNGDTIQKYLIIDVIIKDKIGVYVYVLTNNRLIVFAIDTVNKVDTSLFNYTEMQKVSFSSPDTNRIVVEISLSNNRSLGLEYSTEKKEITDFFQALDQILISNKAHV